MSVDQFLILLLGVVCGGLGWFAKVLYTAVDKLKDDIARLEVRISSDFVRYDRLQEALQPIKDTLSEIRQVLKSKADKP